MPRSQVKPKRIPIKALRDLARQLSQRQAILLCWDGSCSHVVTWGQTTEDCAQAAEGGNRIKDLLGWPETLHAWPSRVRRLQERISQLEIMLETLQGEIDEVPQ
jgi:hypothetical protein